MLRICCCYQLAVVTDLMLLRTCCCYRLAVVAVLLLLPTCYCRGFAVVADLVLLVMRQECRVDETTSWYEGGFTADDLEVEKC